MAKWGEIKCTNCAALEERLEAAQRDAKEAEAYAEELEAKLATCEKYRDAYAECDRIGTQTVRELEAKLAKAMKLIEQATELLIEHAVELSRLDSNPNVRYELTDFTAELTGGKDA